MNYEPFKIKDRNRHTTGGPPGWSAFIMIFSTLRVITLLAFISGMLL